MKMAHGMHSSASRMTSGEHTAPSFQMKKHPELRAALNLRGESGQVKVLRAVATFELSKGLVVLAAGFGLLLLLHKDTSEIAENLLRLLHISPDHRLARMVMRSANHVTDRKLWMFSAFASVYSSLRFVESYGLWKARAWAEWIALISGALYLPLEVHEVMRRANWFHISLLVLNLAIVLYMAHLRLLAHRLHTGDFRS
jgi:uncharacterized membrane protein (DUF2068 family)